MRFEKDIYHMSYAPVFTSMHQQACISLHQHASACISMRQYASACISMHHHRVCIQSVYRIPAVVAPCNVVS